MKMEEDSTTPLLWTAWSQQSVKHTALVACVCEYYDFNYGICLFSLYRSDKKESLLFTKASFQLGLEWYISIPHSCINITKYLVTECKFSTSAFLCVQCSYHAYFVT